MQLRRGITAVALLFVLNNGPAVAQQDLTEPWRKSCRQGVTAFEDERYADAQRHFEAALAEAQFDPHDLQRAELDTLLANVSERLGDQSKAERLYVEAETILEGHETPEPRLQYLILSAIGWFRAEQGRLSESDAHLQRALSAGIRAFGEKHRKTATAKSTLGQVYLAEARFADAEPLLVDAVSVHEEMLPPGDLERLASESGLGILYTAEGRYSSAQPLLQEASEAAHQLGERHPRYAASLVYLADLYRREGLTERVEPLLTQALAIYETSIGPDCSEVANTLLNMSVDALAAKNTSLAEAQLGRALEIFRKRSGPEHPIVAIGQYRLAKAWVQQEKYAEAEVLLKHALSIQERTYPEGHPALANTLRALAEVKNLLEREILAQGRCHRSRIRQARLPNVG
jgi:tetratricopeptide (TPR) repeat protein